MTNYQKLANDLMTSLELSLPPIAVAFSDVVPPNLSSYDDVVPAGCVFWQEAATRTFVTSAKDHELCAIGVHTHNMSPPSASHQAELQEALQAMSGLDYVREEEVAAIPVVQRQVRHVIYGPFADFPLDPEVVLLFAHARQELILNETIARIDKNEHLRILLTVRSAQRSFAQPVPSPPGGSTTHGAAPNEARKRRANEWHVVGCCEELGRTMPAG